jgi:hypothetical protein
MAAHLAPRIMGVAVDKAATSAGQGPRILAAIDYLALSQDDRKGQRSQLADWATTTASSAEQAAKGQD